MKKLSINRRFLILMLIAAFIYLLMAGLALLRYVQRDAFDRSNRLMEVTNATELAIKALTPAIEDMESGKTTKLATVALALRITESIGDKPTVGHLFVIQEDGFVLQYPEDVTFVGTNRIDEKDTTGKPYIRDLIAIATSQPEGGTVIAQINKGPGIEEKEMYALYIPKLNWVVGTCLHESAVYNKVDQMGKRDRIQSTIALFLILCFMMATMVFVLRDIREMANAIEKTAAAETGLKKLLDSMHDGLIIHSVGGTILDANPRACSMFGIRAEDIMRYHIMDISDERHVTQIELNRLFAIALEKDEVVFEWVSKRIDTGELFDTEVVLRKTAWHEQEAILAQVRDISERKRTETVLLESERRYRALYDAVDIGIIMLEKNGIVDANAAATRLFGYHIREFFGLTTTTLFPAEQKSGIRSEAAFHQYLESLYNLPENTVSFLWQQKRRNGELFESETTLSLIDLDKHQLVMMLVRDVTTKIGLEEERELQLSELKMSEERLTVQRNELEDMYRELSEAGEKLQRQYAQLEKAQQELLISNERYQLIAEGANDVIWDWDAKRKRLYVSDRFYELMGYDRQREVFTYDIWRSLVHPDDRGTVQQVYHAHLTGEKNRYAVENRLRAKDGTYRWFLSSGKITLDNEGNVLRFAGSLTDIGEKKQQDGIIGSLAYDDHLTGLPNRIRFLNALESCLVMGGDGALLFMDLDNFKMINDAFGHNYGDRILKTVAELLQAFVQSQEHLLVARFGGDEFMLLAHPIESIDQLVKMADSLIALFAQPISMDESRIHLNCSIGISRFPIDAATSENLLKNSDTALYHAKAMGKRQYQFYSQSMGDEVARRLEMESALRDAIANDEMQLYYQPIVDAESGHIVSFEALIRWFSKRYGLVTPLKFIPLAEETGVIFQLGQWVLQEACRFSLQINQNRANPISVSINVSPIQFMQDNFVEVFTETVAAFGLAHHLMGIEITESILVANIPVVTERLSRLKSMGFPLYLDDFGTGYSSLNYLRKLPLDVVKIDKSFIDGILTDETEMTLVTNIIKMARGLHLKVVAEGVEHGEQMTRLKAAQCDMMQGYHFSRPVPEAEALLQLQKMLPMGDV